MHGLSKGITIPWGSNHYGGTDSLRGAPNVPTMSQLLSSIQYICFRRTSGSNMGAPNLLLAPGAIKPHDAPDNTHHENCNNTYETNGIL